MGKKIIWLAVSLLMSISLLMASCGPAETDEPEDTETPNTPETSGNTETPNTPEASEPEYGGTLNLYANSDPSGYDDGVTLYFLNYTCYLTNEDLLQGDWLKGPAGTEEISWKLGCIGRIEMLNGSLAESYEMPDDETIIYHIRPGIHWQNISPVNGGNTPLQTRHGTSRDISRQKPPT
jgi:ABC-type transport system substrate-binding protein